jgi:hypothetical protein
MYKKIAIAVLFVMATIPTDASVKASVADSTNRNLKWLHYHG